MNQLMISIIVPAYNVDKYVSKCLSSIQNQTYRNWEAIVIDDGSTDKTGDICDSFGSSDRRFQIYHQGNKGVCEARNFALSMARGEIIGFADADDFLDETACERIVNHFADESLDAVFAGHFRVDENDEILEKRNGFPIAEDGSVGAAKCTLLEGTQSYLGVLWNKYFRRECVFRESDYIDFSPSYKVGEDQIWLLEVCRNIRRLGFETAPIYNYRIRNGSAVHAFALTDAKKTEIHARRKMVSLVDEFYPELSILARLKYRSCLNALAIAAIRQKNPEVLRYIVPYSKKYYTAIMRSSVSLKRKIKESFLQAAYIFWGIGKKGEAE